MTATAIQKPPTIAVDPGHHELMRIPLAELHESPLNPRTSYNPQALEELKESLLSTGQLTPVIVRPRKGGGYELAAGHRRYRAAKLAREKNAQGAAFRGLDCLWAVVRPLDERAFIEVLNIENLQRDDLHPLEEATGFRQLMEKAGYDAAKIAARIGRSTKYVYDRIKLLQLVPEAKKMFAAGEFEAGHAIILARLSPDEQRLAIDKDAEGRWGRHAGLFAPEQVHAHPDLPEQQQIQLEDAVKPISVREFQTWVDDNVRLTPERIDPFLFPETGQVLAPATPISWYQKLPLWKRPVAIGNTGRRKQLGELTRSDCQTIAQFYGRSATTMREKADRWAAIALAVAGPETLGAAQRKLAPATLEFLRDETGGEGGND